MQPSPGDPPSKPLPSTRWSTRFRWLITTTAALSLALLALDLAWGSPLMHVSGFGNFGVWSGAFQVMPSPHGDLRRFNRVYPHIELGQAAQLVWMQRYPSETRLDRWKRFYWMPHIYSNPPLYKWALAIPCWIPALCCSALAAVSWTRHLHRPQIPVCPECGYNIEGLSPGSPCPECGTIGDSTTTLTHHSGHS